MSKAWIIVGSSPSVLDHLDTAFKDAGNDARTATANAGLQLFRERDAWPDFYILIDREACWTFGKDAAAAKRQGTKIVSVSGQYKYIKGEGMPKPNITLPTGKLSDVKLPNIGPAKLAFERGQYVYAQFSGLMLLQMAANRGAERVIMVGMDGYEGRMHRPLKVVRFDGAVGDFWGNAYTEQIIQPFTQQVIGACPDIEFIQYGSPLYDLRGDNYRLLPVRGAGDTTASPAPLEIQA